MCSTARSSVTLMWSPRNIASRRRLEPDLLGQRQQRGEHRLGDQALGQVDVEVGRVEGERRDPLGVLGEPGAQARHEAVRERPQRVPGLRGGGVDRGVGTRRHDLACSICSSTVSTSSVHDFLNLSTPSDSRSRNTSSRSIPTASQLVEDRLRALLLAGDPVALDLAVVGEGLQRLLRHGVDRVGDDQVGDVEGVGVVGVLDPGRGPQRPLRLGAGLLELLPAVARDDLEERRVGDPRVGDRGLAAQAEGVVAAERLEPLVDLGVHPGDEERGDRLDLGQVQPGVAGLLEPG